MISPIDALRTAIRWLWRLEREYPGCLNEGAIAKHLEPALVSYDERVVDLQEALRKAIAALNSTPNFRLSGGTDSYALIPRLEAALKGDDGTTILARGYERPPEDPRNTPIGGIDPTCPERLRDESIAQVGAGLDDRTLPPPVGAIHYLWVYARLGLK